MASAEQTAAVGTDPIERLRRLLWRPMPVVGALGFLGFLVVLFSTMNAAQDSPSSAYETDLYIRRTFYAIAWIGLIISLYVGSRAGR